MKWVSHKMATGAILYALTGNILISGLGVLGSTFPDFIEGRVPPQDTTAYKKWRKKHRGLSHWLPPYLLIVCLGIYYLHQFNILTISLDKVLPLIKNWQFNLDIITVHITTYFTAGAVLHILEDAICGYVPLLWLRPRLGIRLFRVGSIWEYTLVFPTAAFLIFWRLAHQYHWEIHKALPSLPSWFL